MTPHTFALTLALAAGAAHGADEVTLTDTSRPDAAGKSFVAATVIDAPLAKLCATIQNYADYPNFMPNVASVKVSEASASASVIDMELHLPMGKVKKYRLRMQAISNAQSCQLSWTMLPWPGLKQEESIVDTSGSWQLTPNGAKTAVRYAVYTDPGPVPYGLGWIVDSMSRDSLPKTLNALRKRVGAAP